MEGAFAERAEQGIAERERAHALRKAFGNAVDRTVQNCDFQEFKDCFPTIGPEFHDLLYDLYVQVVQSIRSNCRSEYSDIAQEHQIIEKLNMLDQMCEEQGMDGTDGSMPRPPPASVMPSQLARLERVKLKLKEKEALRDLLSEAEAQKAKATVALEARRKEVLVLKEKIQATEGGLEEVHRSSKLWAARPMVN